MKFWLMLKLEISYRVIIISLMDFWYGLAYQGKGYCVQIHYRV
jgi:hypothetical protein